MIINPLLNLENRIIYIHILGPDNCLVHRDYISKISGTRVNQSREQLYINLFDLLDEYNIKYEIHAKPRGGNRIIKRVNPRKLYITYHTCDNRPNVWNVKSSHILGYFYFDKYGYSGWSEMANNPELFLRSQKISDRRAINFYEKIKSEIVNNEITIYEQKDKGILIPKPYLFCPMQKPDDVVSAHSRIPTITLACELVSCFAGSRNINIVLKRHPSDHSLATRIWLSRVKNKYFNIYVSDASIHKLIKGSLGVITTNSGVGFEALLHMKPVFTAGKTDYEWVTERIYSKDDLPKIPKICERLLNRKRIMKFLCYFLEDYLVKSTDKASLFKKLRSIESW